MKYAVKKINGSNISSIGTLAAAAKSEGFNFVRRTIDEWQNGENDFSKPGEVLWGVFDQTICIAIAGVNIDPYADDAKIGRVRHLYVLPQYRRQRIARFLLEKIIEIAKKDFILLRLSAYKPGGSNDPASCLYESMGFIKEEKDHQTHVLNLKFTRI